MIPTFETRRPPMRRPFAALSVLAFVFAACQAASLRADEPKSKPTDARPRVTLTWSTASEVDNYGYFVMRGDDEKGPFKAVNEKVIPGASNSDMPRGYRYEDFDVAQGKTYWYYLESLSTAGVREKFSPVLKRQCCKVPGAA